MLCGSTDAHRMTFVVNKHLWKHSETAMCAGPHKVRVKTKHPADELQVALRMSGHAQPRNQCGETYDLPSFMRSLHAPTAASTPSKLKHPMPTQARPCATPVWRAASIVRLHIQYTIVR